MTISTKVGSFAKKTSTGSQVITGVGFTPKAILFWAEGDAADQTWTGGISAFVGMTTGASQSACTTMTSADGGAASAEANANRSLTNPIVLINTALTTVAQCTLTSFNVDGFTLNWTTASATASTIHFLALGGTGITNAKVVANTVPSSGTSWAITNVGFQPNMALHLCAPNSNNSANTKSNLALGAMDGAGNQWAMAVAANHNANPSVTKRWFATNRCAYEFQNQTELSYTSMDATGFTLGINHAGFFNSMYSLCLAGDGFAVGSLTKSTTAATVSQAVTGLGLQPVALILASIFAATPNTQDNNATWALGASDGSTSHAAAFTNFNGLTPTVAKSYSSASKIALKTDNSTPALDAAAGLTSFDSDGFTLSWTTNDAVATPIYYLAMGSAAAGVNGSVTAVVATATAAMLAPTVAGTQNPTVAAPLATATAAMLAPTVTAVRNATVAMPVMTASAAAAAPSVAGVQNATVSIPLMTANANANAPTLSLVQDATVAAPAMTATATANAPTLTGTANVSAVVMTATSAALAPGATGTRNPTVSAPVMIATALALAPTLSGTQNAAVSAPLMQATGSTLAPTVAATRNPSVAAPVMTATAAMLAPAVSAGVNASVSAVAMTATATANAPTVAADRSAAISAPVMTAQAAALAPSVSATRNPTVAIPAMTASAQATAPTLSGSATIAAALMTANAALNAPTASGGAVVASPLMTALAAMRTMQASGDATIDAELMTATALMLPPIVRAFLPVRVGSASLMAAPRISGALMAAPRLTATLDATPRITGTLTKG